MDTLDRHEPRRRGGRLAALLIVGVGLPALVAGCDYFRPTRPEVPSGDSVPPDYSTAAATLVTLQLAIQDKSATNGQSAYVGGFADLNTDGQTYQAVFDPITVARFPGQPTDWDTGREEIFYANLSRLLPTSSFAFVWGDFLGAPDDDDDQPTTAILYRSYLLQATPDDGSTFVPVARGNAELHFAKISDKWKIVRWVDSEDPLADFDTGELSFGQLRLAGP